MARTKISNPRDSEYAAVRRRSLDEGAAFSRRAIMANGGSKHPTTPQQDTKTAGQPATEQSKSGKK